MPDNIIKRKYLITSADVDFTKTLKLSSLTNFLIQIAWNHAEELGWGIDFLHNNNYAWVLSRIQIKIIDHPVWNDTITVTSWPKGIHRLFYLRDMEVHDGKGNLVALVTSQWLIIDVKHKRPKLINPENNIFQENKDRHAIQNNEPNVIFQEGEIKEYQYKTLYSDIDLNQHLTTTRYIDFMLDSFTIDEINKYPFGEISMNFIHEIPFSETVIVKRSFLEQENAYYFKFSSLDAKQTFFLGKLIV